jgi:hypothetical protein
MPYKPLKLLVVVLFWVALFCAGTALLKAQELDPLIDVDVSHLNVDVRDRLASFQQDISNYLSKTRFTDEAIVNDARNKPYKIKCNFSFFFNSSSGTDGYNAQVVVSVQRNVYRSPNFTSLFRIKDESWDFNYVRGQSFYHDNLKFNNLTSFLDYYAYLIIGLDDDSWELQLGTKRFQQAQDIVNLALGNSGNSGSGWTDNSSLKASRSSYPLELLNSKYDNYRKGVWMYHFAGMDSLQYNKRQALERMSSAIDLIAKTKKTEVKSFSIKAFFDAKYLEIAQAMTDYYDKTIYRRLGDVDPDHLSTYEDYSKK